MLTKSGRPIRFTFTWDHQDGIDSTFIVHLITAEVDGEEAGYLKISYVPKEKFSIHTPDAMHYMGKLRGWCGVQDAFEKKDKVALVKSVARYIHDSPVFNASDKEISANGQEWLNEKIKEYKQKVNKKHGTIFKEFADYHLNKPKVDFIRVYEKGEKVRNHFDNDAEERESTKDFTRQHIALALYKAGALWMAQHGLKLYASTLQSKSAEAVWNIMSETEGLKVVKDSSTKDSKGKPIHRRYLVVKD